MVYAKTQQAEKAVSLLETELNREDLRSFGYRKFFPITVIIPRHEKNFQKL